MNNQNKPILKKFDTKVQYLKYKVLREVARHTYDDDNLVTSFNDIAKTIVKDKATMRCCISVSYTHLPYLLPMTSFCRCSL